MQSERSDLRAAFVAALIEKARAGVPYTIISVDSKKSSLAEAVERDFPDHFLDLGVMEQCAAGVAAGLASCGNKVFIIGIASFITLRAYEQLRTLLSHNNYDVKIIGLWSGLYYAFQGHTHVPHEDISIMRTLENVTIYSPSSFNDVRDIVSQLFVESGFSYVRIENPFLPQDIREYRNCAQDARQLQIVRRGSRVILISTGRSLAVAQGAADDLARAGLNCTILNAVCLHPLDTKTLLNFLRAGDVVATIEEHGELGGLGTTVAEVLAAHRVRTQLLKFSGSPKYPTNMSYDSALDNFGLTSSNISRAVLAAVGSGETEVR